MTARDKPTISTAADARPIKVNKPKTATDPADTAEGQERLGYGREALYCEHPGDDRNRPDGDDFVPAAALGPDLDGLCRRAFVGAPRDPGARPTARDWLGALDRAADMLRPCAGGECPRRGFVVSGPGPLACPFCGATAAGPTPTLALPDETRGGPAVVRRLVIDKGLTLHRWHTEAGVTQGPAVAHDPVALVRPSQGRFRLVNAGPGEMKRPDGRVIRVRGSVTLKGAMTLRLSTARDGRLARLEFW